MHRLPLKLFATAFGALVALAIPVAPSAQTVPTGFRLTQNCTIVGTSDAKDVLGFAVQTPDATTETGGICAFPSESITQEGIVSYSVVTTADVLARRFYFRLLAVKCGSVDSRAPNAAQCTTFHKLAFTTTAAQYYAARAGTPDAIPQPGLGDAAVATASAVYVLRGDEVFESAVRRSEFLDVDKSVALATLLLARVAPVAAPPVPAASNTP